MPTATVCPQVTLTIEISEVLFHGIQVSAAMSRTTIDVVVQSALRQIAFERETPANESQALEVRTPHPIRRASGKPCLGPIQRAILGSLDAAVADVYDLRELRRTIHQYHRTAVSRAVHKLVNLGFLEPMMPTGAGFQPDDGRQGQLRFVRRAAAS